MDYSDATVIIAVKGEPAVGKVAKDVLGALTNCRVIVAYKGRLDMKLSHRNLRLMEQRGVGKGTAMVQAGKLVKTPIICFIDGDNTYEVSDLKKVIQKVRDGADMALGNRFAGMAKGAMSGYIIFGNKVLTFTANLLYGLRISDSQTGLRAIKKKVFEDLHLREAQFGIEEEMNIKCQKKGYKVVQVPAKYYIRTGTTKHSKPFGGLKLLFINFKFLFK